jgi:hypothetical protein
VRNSQGLRNYGNRNYIKNQDNESVKIKNRDKSNPLKIETRDRIKTKNPDPPRIESRNPPKFKVDRPPQIKQNTKPPKQNIRPPDKQPNKRN